MRILHISTRLILGGSQENTVLSCQGQADLGHEVHLAYGPIYGPEGSMLRRVRDFRTTDGRSIRTHEIKHLIRAIHPWHDALCYRELKALIADIRPDIVHTHSSKAGVIGRAAGWSVKRGSRQRSPAVIHTIHGPPFHDHLPAWKNRIYEISERFAARRCDRIVSVADAMTRRYVARGVFDDSFARSRCETIESGMEIGPYIDGSAAERRDALRAQLGLDPDDIVLGTVARLAELKGHDNLLDAAAGQMREDPRIKLLWVGDGYRRGRLESRIASLGLQGRVVLTGLVPPEDVPGYIAAMDALVHPSYREGLPRTVVQGMLGARPVVAYDCDGTPEVVIDGQTGRLVKTGDVRALADAIRWVVEHPERAREMGARGREACRERFSAERMVAKLDALYLRALAEDTGRAQTSHGSASRSA